MEKRTQVVVYGGSLHMAGIAASLKAEIALEVVCVNPQSPTARQRLNELDPAVIVFDLSNPPQNLDVTLLRERPEFVWIGVHPSSDKMLVLSGRQEQSLSVADLVQVIVGGSEGCSSGQLKLPEQGEQGPLPCPGESAG